MVRRCHYVESSLTINDSLGGGLITGGGCRGEDLNCDDVYVYTGNLTLLGGSIVGVNYQSSVSVYKGTLTVGGTAQIYGAKDGVVKGGVVIDKDGVIECSEWTPLKDGAKIDVAVSDSFVPTEGNPTAITTKGTKDYRKYFTCDSHPEYYIANDDNRVKLYAEETYTVTFDANGKSNNANTQGVKAGEKAHTPINPTALNMRVEGWYKEKACTNAWDFDTDVINSDTTIYAKWIDTATTPLPTNDTAKKTSRTQASIDFTLANEPAYTDNQKWKVYANDNDTDIMSEITASNVGNTLTLTHATDIPAGTYYVSATENGKADSTCLALTVEEYTVTNYGIWVGGTQVNNENASDVFGDGTVSYTPAIFKMEGDEHIDIPQTLTLNGATINTGYAFDAAKAGILCEGDLTIKLKGKSTVNGVNANSGLSSYGIFVLNTLTIEDDLSDKTVGSLTVKGYDNGEQYGSYGIFALAGITINSGVITSIGGNANDSCGIFSFSEIKINGGTVETKSTNTTGTAQAMNMAPNLSDYTKSTPLFTASTNADGSSPVATYDENDIATYKYLKIKPKHIHDNWQYEVNGATITATCGEYGCTDTPYSEALTINAPSSLTYDGTEKPANLSDKTSLVSDLKSISVINYEIKDAEGNYVNLDNESVPVSAGEYRAKISCSDKIAFVEYTIEKATPTYTTPTGLNATYGQTLADVSLPTGFTWESETTTSVGNVGNNSFTIKYTPADTTNYKEIMGISVSINVAQRPVNINWIGTDNLVFDNTRKTVTAEVSNKVGTDVINLTVTGNEETAKGEYTAEVTSIDNANYTLENGTNLTKVWSISNAANVWITALDITGWTFGENPNTPTATAKYGTAAFTYSDTADGAYTPIVPTNAGTYFVKAEIAGTEDYSEISDTKEFTISPKAIAPSINDIDVQTYIGSAITPAITVKNGETSLSNTDYDVAYENNINIGTANVKVTLKGNYSGKCEKEFTINPKQINNAITLTAPIKNSTPQTTIETDEYTASVVWSPEVTTSFSSSTIYTATVTITPKANYTTDGIAEYTVSGAATVIVDETDNKIITAVFPKTGSSGGGGSSISYYTVKFETNGGSTVKSQSVRRNNTVSTITEPTKDGYTFDGWFIDKAFAKAFDSTSKITSGITLYAKWTEIRKDEPVIDNSENEITLTIGQKDATVFGEAKQNDVAPIIRNDRTMLPARFVAEALGATVTWNNKERKVTITKDDITIIIYIDSDKAYANGKEVTLDSPAFIENDRTYTPLRFIAENLGATVDWNETEQKVIITKK